MRLMSVNYDSTVTNVKIFVSSVELDIMNTEKFQALLLI